MNLHSYQKRQGERGSAMVEFSILMIVFIPMLVYSWYLHDIGHHMLDLQETVISTTWDYTSRTYEGIDDQNKQKTALDNVYHANRFEYLDHTSAYDDFANLSSSNDEKKYHYELGSKAAWVQGSQLPPGGGQDLGLGSVGIGSYANDYKAANSRQITCAVDGTGDMEWALFGFGDCSGVGMISPLCGFAKTNLAKSGAVTCWAKLEVYNYVIPEKWLHGTAGQGSFANEDMTKDKLQTRTANVENLNNADGQVLRDHASVSFGTWAINNADTNITSQTSQSKAKDGDLDYCPDSKNPFYERVNWVATGGSFGGLPNTNAIGYLAAYGMMASFMGQALSNQLEIAQAIPMIPGTMDGSPEGFSCPTFAAFEAFGGRPANLSAVNLVARHDRQNFSTGVLEKAPGWFDFIAMEPGYESTPAKVNNSKFNQAWQNRGAYYMGDKNDKG